MTLVSMERVVKVYKCPECNRFLCKGYYAPGSQVDLRCHNCKKWTTIEVN